MHEGWSDCEPYQSQHELDLQTSHAMFGTIWEYGPKHEFQKPIIRCLL